MGHVEVVMPNTAVMKNVDELLGRAAITLLVKEPFFAHLIAGITREVTSSIPTMAVGIVAGQPRLFVNPVFFATELRSEPMRIGVLKHEVLHLLFKHLFRFMPHYDAELYNIAADLVVNQYIGSWRIPSSAITLKTFSELELEPERETEYYYNALRKAQEEPANAGAEVLEAVYGKPRHSDHSTWSKTDRQESSLADVAEIELDRLIVQAYSRCTVKQRGTIPGNIAELIQEMIERRAPKVDWRRALRIFSSTSRKTVIRSTMKRPSKRFHTFPGIRIRRFQKLMVILDTSGSVDEDELAAFFVEIHGMYRAGADISVMEADADVQRVFKYTGHLPKELHGRGGTSFDPPFEWLRLHRREQYDACIYLTDGEAPAPTVRPPCRLLWVVSERGKIGDHLRFGQAIQIEIGGES